MQLLSLRVENFGLFRGTHYFDLAAPATSGANGRIPNLTVFVGHNGAGKSTLFQAIGVALHGVQALGGKVNAVQYNDFLYERMHRQHKEGSKTVVSTEALVSLTFSFVQSGISRRVHVTRRWQRNGRVVGENLEVLQDSQLLASEAADAQAWINDLFPPNMARLCFFDAEDLDALAGADQVNPALGEALQRLLGLDLIQRAQADLRSYIIKQGGSSAVSNLSHVVLAHQTSLETLDRQIEALNTRMEPLTDEEAAIQAQIAEDERLLAAAGGLYAARRTVQQERLEVIGGETAVVQAQIADQASHLLPFALTPQLCQRLAARVTQEETVQREQVAQTLLGERLTQIESAIRDESFWGNVQVLPKRQDLLQRLHDVIETHRPALDAHAPLLHHLADPERIQLRSWITQTLEVVPGQVQQLGGRLRGLQEEHRSLELDLQRAPDDAALAPLHAAILHFQTALVDVQRRRRQLQEEISGLQYRRTEKDRAMQRSIKILTDAQAGETELALAERSRSVLRAYEYTLTRQRLSALEKALAQCFNALCQKEHLLAAVKIEPGEFTVQLESADNRILHLSSFSAGERQLYALALLQAMRKVSDQQLPLLVDTPLARLDAEHRHRLLHGYLPTVSDQVLLFATDAEADTPFLEEAQPYLAYAYRLRFDPTHGDTEATQIKQDFDLRPEHLSLQELPYAF